MLFLSSVFLLISCSWYGLFCISYFIVDPIKIWKVLMCFGACPDWFTISFFKKTHFFSLNFHCFYKQFTKFTALFYLTLFTIIHLYFKSIQIKIAGEFLLTSFNGFQYFLGARCRFVITVSPLLHKMKQCLPQLWFWKIPLSVKLIRKGQF